MSTRLTQPLGATRLVLAFAALTAIASPALAGYIAPSADPIAAPAYDASEGLKIKPTGETKPKQYVGHVTLIRREINPTFVGNPATGGWTGFATYDVLADVSFDDGLTFEPAQALDIPIDFDFTPVAPSSIPGTTEYALRTGVQKVIILLTDGAENIHVRQSPTLPSAGKFFTSSQGPYQIDSFFDVFTELSLDGGATWTPAEAPLRLTALPEPAALAFLPLALPLLMRRRSN